MRKNRRAVTMIELLIVVGILGLLLGISIPALLKARESGARTESINNLRQIIIATHNYLESNQGIVPGYADNFDGVAMSPSSVFVEILPFVDQASVDQWNSGGLFPRVATYLSPVDPTLDLNNGATSYCANHEFFKLSMKITHVTDGVSNTIAFGEHYSVCQSAVFTWSTGFPWDPLRRATFADWAANDVFPRTAAESGDSLPSSPGVTFQAAPRVIDCDPRQAQTPHPNGMLVAMGDGSVRAIGANVSVQSYWAAITPSGRENATIDW